MIPDDMENMTAAGFERTYGGTAEFFKGVSSLLFLMGLGGFVYTIYRNIVDGRTPNVSTTNISGHNINAGPGAVVGTDSARVNTGTHIENSTVNVTQSIGEALDTILTAIKESELSDDQKFKARGLAEEIKDGEKTEGQSSRMSELVAGFIGIAKDIGPAAKSVTEAISVLRKIAGL